MSVTHSEEQTMAEMERGLAGLAAVCEAAENDQGLFLKGVLACLCEMTGAAYAVFSSFDFDNNRMVTLQAHGDPGGFRQFGRLQGRVCFESLIGEGQNQVAYDDLQQSPFAISDPDIKRYQIRAYLGTAVRQAGQTVGSLALYDKIARPFAGWHFQLVRIVAQMVATHTDRYRLMARFQQKNRHDQLLSVVSSKAITTHDRSFLDYCLELIGKEMGVDTAFLLFYDEETQLFGPDNRHWVSQEGAKRATVEKYAFADMPFVREVLQSRRPYTVKASDNSSDAATHLFLSDHGIVSLLVLPICNQERFYGFLMMSMQEENRLWEEGDLNILADIMGVVAQWRAGRAISDQLDESRAVLHQMFQLSPTAIYRIDFRTRRLVTFNEMVMQASGYNEEELLAMDAAEFLAPESRQLFLDRILEMAAGLPVPEDVEFQILTKSGEIEWGHFHTRFLYEEGQVWGANVIAHIITEKKRAMEELAEYRKRLEALVEERTRELSLANEKLTVEVARRTETARELRLKSERLEELNTAMRVLLDKRNEERLRSEENIRVNLVQLIEPYLDRLDNSGLSDIQSQLLEVIRMNLNEVVGSPMPELSAKYYIFSPSELQVANLIRKGRTTKEMAKLMNISSRTVESYRNSIRKKLGLKNKKVNLKTYLSSKE